MAPADRQQFIARRTPESAAMTAEVRRAHAITARINRLGYDDAEEVRALVSKLLGRTVDDNFFLLPPFFATGGSHTTIGRNVFVNQNCTFYDLGGLTIGDDVMIGPNVSLITSGHPIAPSKRRSGVTVIGGVTVGKNSVIAAGSVVTRDVPPSSLVGGNPARVIRSIED